MGASPHVQPRPTSLRGAVALVVLVLLALVRQGATDGPSQSSPAWVEEVTSGLVVCRVQWSSVSGQPVRWSLLSASSGSVVSAENDVPGIEVRGHGRLTTIKANPVRIISNGTIKVIAVEAARTADGKVDVEVRRYFELKEGYPVVRMWTEIGNVSSNAVISGCDFLKANLLLPAEVEYSTLFFVNQFNWPFAGTSTMAPRAIAINKGQWPNHLRMGSQASAHGELTQCGWFALQPGGTTGLFVGVEFNGKSVATVETGDDGLTRAVVSAASINHTLSGFTAPPIFVGLFDDDWDEAAYLTQRYVEAHLAIPLPSDSYPFAQYDSWQWNVNINEESMLRELELANYIGLEVFVLDLGWAAQIGDWKPDPVKFPRGLRPLTDRAHQLGIRFGLHVPAAQAALSAPVILQHPNWLAYNISNEYFGASAICLSHQPVREWLLQQLVDLVDRYKIDYFVQDGEDMVKRCTKSTHTHNRGDENYSNAVEGIDWLWLELRRLRPNIVLENCEDGGNMLTQRVPQIYHTSISVDDDNTQATRLGVFGMSYPFSPRYSARYLQDSPSTYTLRSSMFGGPLILQLNLSSLTPDQLQLTRQHVAEYKRYRSLIRDGKVYHLQRPTEDATGYDAIQSVNANRTRSVVFVYCAQKPLSGAITFDDAFVLKPRGLIASARYSVRFVDDGKEIFMQGAALMTSGLSISLMPLSAIIVEINTA